MEIVAIVWIVLALLVVFLAAVGVRDDSYGWNARKVLRILVGRRRR